MTYSLNQHKSVSKQTVTVMPRSLLFQAHMESDLLSEIKTVCKAVSPKLLDSNHFVVAMDAISSWMKLPSFFLGD